MKALSVIALVLSVLAFAVCAFFGYFSWQNSEAADRLAAKLPKGGGFVVAIVRDKAEKQMQLSLGAGGAAVLLLGTGLVLGRAAKRSTAPAPAPVAPQY